MLCAQREPNTWLHKRAEILTKYDRFAVSGGSDQERDWILCRGSKPPEQSRALDRCRRIAALIVQQRADHRTSF